MAKINTPEELEYSTGYEHKQSVLRLCENGYKESNQKLNLFYRRIEGGCLYADLRGTQRVPIEKDSRPLFYWHFENSIPSWKVRRITRSELKQLFESGVPCRLSSIFLDYHKQFKDFRRVDIDIIEEDGVYEWPVGYCLLCGEDFQNEGEFCSLECQERYHYHKSNFLADYANPMI